MVAVIGRKHSGKTTLTVRLAAELGRRGHRVMTIKHGTHTFNIDPSTTDTYRHYHEGRAARVAMVAPDKFALIMRWERELAPEEIAARYMSDAAVVVCEGFKMSSLPKIEVFRRAAHPEPLFGSPGAHAGPLLAVATDVDELAAPAPVVRFADAGWLERLAEIVEREVMEVDE
jgi:molybdopterin-guanine dinucleotide biosynthesis protein B